MAFSVEVNNVWRDVVQGLFGNRPRLDSEDALDMYGHWDELVVGSMKPGSNLTFGAIEVGGATPQVTALYLNDDWTETIRKIREQCPNAAIRPLLRCANVSMLDAQPVNVIDHYIGQNIEDSAGEHLENRDSTQELWRGKFFDSQNIVKEMESSVDSVLKYTQDGYPATIEFVISYANGEGCDPARPQYTRTRTTITLIRFPKFSTWPTRKG